MNSSQWLPLAVTEAEDFTFMAFIVGIGVFAVIMSFLVSLRFRPIYRKLVAKRGVDAAEAAMRKKVSSVKKACAAAILIALLVLGLIYYAPSSARVVAVGVPGSLVILAAAIYILAVRLNYRG
jgi:hypothetical protein